MVEKTLEPYITWDKQTEKQQENQNNKKKAKYNCQTGKVCGLDKSRGGVNNWDCLE